MAKTLALCGLSEVIHFYDLTKASVHDINFLQDINNYIMIVVSLVIDDISASRYNLIYLRR